MGVVAVLLAVLSILLLAGVADPPHADQLLMSRAFLGVATPAVTEIFQVYPSYYDLPARGFTLEAIAVHQQASLAWGLWLKTDSHFLLVGISTEGSHGYVTARLCPELSANFEACPTLSEPNQGIQTGWKEAIFLKPSEQNEIYLHYEPERGVLVLRLNREWMWDLPFLAPPQVEWGRWQRADLDTGINELNWLLLRVWGDPENTR